MKPFGIRMTLPAGDPLRAPHLLGDDWVAQRWYRTQAERDLVFAELQREQPYARIGDKPSLILEKIDRPAPASSLKETDLRL